MMVKDHPGIVSALELVAILNGKEVWISGGVTSDWPYTSCHMYSSHDGETWTREARMN